MTEQLILEWIEETCAAYGIPKPFAIVEALQAARATPADHSVPVAKVRIHAMWASGGCTGFNDYLMTDYSIRTLKAIDLKRGQVFPPNDGSYESVLPTNPYAKSLTDKLEKAAQPPQNAADHIEAQSVRDAGLDSARLDYLDKRNARKNESNGTVYGWKEAEKELK